jgi:hypothetical protein
MDAVVLIKHASNEWSWNRSVLVNLTALVAIVVMGRPVEMWKVVAVIVMWMVMVPIVTWMVETKDPSRHARQRGKMSLL